MSKVVKMPKLPKNQKAALEKTEGVVAELLRTLTARPRTKTQDRWLELAAEKFRDALYACEQVGSKSPAEPPEKGAFDGGAPEVEK